MENISSRLSYVKGLMEGMNFDETSNEGKIFKALLSVLDEINDSIDDLYDYQDEIAEQVDLIDEDLAAVEEGLLEDDECDCDDYCDEEYYEVECPECHEIVCVDEDTLLQNEDIYCPNCKAKIDIDLEDCDCDDCCDCGCEDDE